MHERELNGAKSFDLSDSVLIKKFLYKGQRPDDIYEQIKILLSIFYSDKCSFRDRCNSGTAYIYKTIESGGKVTQDFIVSYKRFLDQVGGELGNSSNLRSNKIHVLTSMSTSLLHLYLYHSNYFDFLSTLNNVCMLHETLDEKEMMAPYYYTCSLSSRVFLLRSLYNSSVVDGEEVLFSNYDSRSVDTAIRLLKHGSYLGIENNNKTPFQELSTSIGLVSRFNEKVSCYECGRRIAASDLKFMEGCFHLKKKSGKKEMMLNKYFSSLFSNRDKFFSSSS